MNPCNRYRSDTIFCRMSKFHICQFLECIAVFRCLRKHSTHLPTVISHLWASFAQSASDLHLLSAGGSPGQSDLHLPSSTGFSSHLPVSGLQIGVVSGQLPSLGQSLDELASSHAVMIMHRLIKYILILRILYLAE